MVLEVTRTAPGASAAATWDDGRIPGAHAVDFADLVGEPGLGTGATPLPSAAQLRELVVRWGIHDHSTVVVATADHPSTATRVWWVLRWAGLADVRFLDGGRDAWLTQGSALSTAAPREGGGTATVSLGSLPTVGAEAAGELAREGRLLDARSADAYAGSDDGSTPTGHIPGAVHLPASSALDGGYLADPESLRELYAPYLDGAPLAASCGSGVAATVDLLALATLGVSAALYPGSFSGWVSEGRPVSRPAPDLRTAPR